MGPQLAEDYRAICQSSHDLLFVQTLQIEGQILGWYQSIHLYISIRHYRLVLSEHLLDAFVLISKG